MGLKDCIIAAHERGAITKEEASTIIDEYDRRFAQHRLSMGDDVARARARDDMEKALVAEAAEKRRRANLTEAARLRVEGQLKGFRTAADKPDIAGAAMGLLSHYGFKAGGSVRGKTEAIVAAAHGRLSDLMFAFERKGILGKRPNRALESDVVRELHGEAAGDATAKSLARSIDKVFEDLRQRFNAAGGAIGKLDNFGLPHSHDWRMIKREGRAGWKSFIRPLLDPDRMINPLTGQPVGAAGIDAALDHVFDSIVSRNRAHMQPQMARQGLGAIATQRQDERFLHFLDAEGWLAYNKRFGNADVIQAIFNHINGMARDIAAMEVLGPNPAAMVEYLKQVVGHEGGKRDVGKASLAKPNRLLFDSGTDWAVNRIEWLWQTMRGRPEVVSGAANITANIKNFLTSAQLGSTALLAASTDPFVAASARRLAGLPVTSTIRDMARALKKSNREEIVRSGVIWDEYQHVMQDELRFAGALNGSDWSRWLADRTIAWSGLKPLTTARKMVEARAWQATIADNAGKTFKQLDKRFRTALEGFGVEPGDWEIWRKAVDSNGFVTAAQIEANGGAVQYVGISGAGLTTEGDAEVKALAHRAAAEKLSEVISSWSERSVPAGTPNTRSVATAAADRGTVPGEVIDFFLQYKSFGLSFTAMQLEAMGEMAAARGGGRGARTGLAYLAGMAVPLTLGGAVYMQIKSVLDGKEPADMTEPNFWVRAGLQGGGFGLFGDFAKATENRFGQSMQEALSGPGFALIGDVASLPWGGGREFTRFVRRYTPVLSSHWATRGAYNRLVLDNLQWLLDPAADKSFKSQASMAKKNGAPFFKGLEPGAMTPGR